MNLYDIIGVDKKASTDEIKRAYKRKALELHPDKNNGNKEEFQKLTHAYEVLSDDDKRRKYDIDNMFGRRNGEGEFDFSANGANGSESESQNMRTQFREFFNTFNDNRGHGYSDVKINMNEEQDWDKTNHTYSVTLEDIFQKKKQQLRYNRTVQCDDCLGSGLRPGANPPPCGHCDGSGTIENSLGFIVSDEKCTRCRGKGLLITPKDKCVKCNGTSMLKKPHVIEFLIPDMVHNKTLLVRNAGCQLRNGKWTDLQITFEVTPHELFELRGRNLHFKKFIDLADALCGFTYYIKHPSGKKLKITEKQPIMNGQEKIFKKYGIGTSSMMIIYYRINPVRKAIDPKYHATIREALE